jgi:hypothetical protein
MKKKIQKARAVKLRKVRAALKIRVNSPDLRTRIRTIAVRTGVTQNFISYAIRRGEIKIPGTLEID